MRELALVAAVLVVCCLGLVMPRVGLYGFMCFALLRPDELAWSEGKYPFSAALAGATLLGAIRFAPNIPRLWRNPITRLLILLQIPIALSVLFPVGAFLSSDRYSEYARMLVMVLLIPLLVESQSHVRTLLLVMAGSLGLLGIKFGIYGIFHGGVQYTEGLGNQYDNNTLGIAMAMAVPLCWHCMSLVSSRLARMALAGMVVTAAATVVMTNSRGASVSLAVGFLYVAARSRHKILTLCAFALATIPSIYLVQDQYFSRMKTIQDYKEEASAASRIEFAKAAINMWKAYPVLGVGFGSRNYAALNDKFLGRADVHAAHNTYLQMLADSGSFAYLIYTSLLFGTVLWLHKTAKTKRERDDGNIAGSLALATVTPMIVFLVGCTFGSMQRYDFPYMLLMCAAALHVVQEGEEEQVSPEGEEAALSEVTF